MATSNKIGNFQKKSKSSSKISRKKVVMGPWLFYFASLMAFTGFCYNFAQREFTWAVGLGTLSLILLFIPLINLSALKISDSWNSAYTPPNLLKDQTVQYAALFFFLYLVFVFWKLLIHPNLLIAGYDEIFYYPYKFYWTESIKQGDPAFWNPNYHLGIPFFAWPPVSAASPFNLLHLILPHTFAITIETLLHYFFAAMGIFLLLRLWGVGWKGAVLGGMAYTFGGYSFLRIHQGQFFVFFPAVWVPWMIWCTERYFHEKKKFWVAIAGLFSCLCYLEGFPQTSQYSMMIFAAYLLGVWLFKGANFSRVFWTGLSVLACYIALSAFALLPQIEYITLTNRWHYGYGDIMENHYKLANFITFVDPMRGSSMEGRSGEEGISGWVESGNYIGYIPLLLFFGGLFFLRKTPKILWFWFLSVFFTVLSMGADNKISKALFDFFYYYFPLFSHHRNLGRLQIAVLFFMICIAAMTLDAIEKRFKNGKSNKYNWLFTIALALTIFNFWHYDHRMLGITTPDSYASSQLMFSDKAMKIIQSDPSYPRIQGDHDFGANLIYNLSQVQTWEDTWPTDSGRYVQVTHDDWDTPLSDLIGLKYLYMPKWFASPPPSGRWMPLVDGTVYNTKILPRAFIVGGYRVQKGGELEDVVQIQKGMVDCSGGRRCGRSCR